MEIHNPPPVDQGTDRELVEERLTRLTQAVNSNLSVLAQQDTPRAVHDTRITTRRLRVALRNLKRQLPSRQRRRCRMALVEIARNCSALRDADVRRALVRTLVTRAGFEHHPQGQLLLAAAARDRETAGHELQRRMNAPKWSELLWDLTQNVAAVIAGVHGASREGIIREVLIAQQRRLRRRLRKGTRSLKRLKLHRLRLRIKDARYFAEDFGPLVGAPIEAELPRLRELQKALGDLHDAWCLDKWLRTQHKAYLVTGALRDLLVARKKKLRKRVRQLGKAIIGRGARVAIPAPEVWARSSRRPD
jgi:CHAD domain-containing protein